MHKIITSILEIFGHLEEFVCVRVCFFSENCRLKKKKKRKRRDKEDFTVCKNKNKKKNGCLEPPASSRRELLNAAARAWNRMGVEEQHLWFSKPSLVLKSSFGFSAGLRFRVRAFVSTSTHYCESLRRPGSPPTGVMLGDGTTHTPGTVCGKTTGTCASHRGDIKTD